MDTSSGCRFIVVFHKPIMNAAAAHHRGPVPDLRKPDNGHELQLPYHWKVNVYRHMDSNAQIYRHETVAMYYSCCFSVRDRAAAQRGA
jgi:hypothetical protein